MTDPNEPLPEPDDDALDDVESLGGDDEIMESLPSEGSPISVETAYDEIDGSGALDDGAAHDYSSDEPATLDPLAFDLAYESEVAESEPADEADRPVEADAVYDPSDPYAPARYDTSEFYAVETGEGSDYDFLDIEAALASVASLGDVVAERERAEIAEQIAIETAVQEQEEKRRPLRRVSAPPLLTMRRGHLASVVPALVLIVLGGWLTFAVTAPNAVPVSPLLVVLALGAAVIVTLLAFWLASGRWSRGVFFFALLALLTAGALYYETTLKLTFSISGALVLAASGLAFALTGLFARPTDRRLLLPGMLFLAAAGVNLAVTIGYLPATLLTGAAPYWPVLVALVVVLWLLPALTKRRG